MAGAFMSKLLNIVGFETAEEEYEMKEEYRYEDFSYEESISSKQKAKKESEYVSPSAVNGKMKMVVYHPIDNRDAQAIIDCLKERKPVVVNLEGMDIEVSRRIIDFIAGAVYAIGGNIEKVARRIYVVAPNDVDLASKTDENL